MKSNFECSCAAQPGFATTLSLVEAQVVLLLVWSSPQCKMPRVQPRSHLKCSNDLSGTVFRRIQRYFKRSLGIPQVDEVSVATRDKTVTFSTSIHKFKHPRRFTVQNLTSQTAPRAARSEEITLKLHTGSPSEEQSHPNPGERHAFPIACYRRGSALLYFLPLFSSASALAGHKHLLCKQVKLGPRALP